MRRLIRLRKDHLLDERRASFVVRHPSRHRCRADAARPGRVPQLTGGPARGLGPIVRSRPERGGGCGKFENGVLVQRAEVTAAWRTLRAAALVGINACHGRCLVPTTEVELVMSARPLRKQHHRHWSTLSSEDGEVEAAESPVPTPDTVPRAVRPGTRARCRSGRPQFDSPPSNSLRPIAHNVTIAHAGPADQ